MTIHTPGLDFGALAPLASRLVDVAGLEWSPTPFAGIEVKTLVKDSETGLMTCLHEHVRLEQTYVLEGSLIDEDGEVTAGNFVWRPGGSRHVAVAPQGALVLCFFLEPNKFL